MHSVRMKITILNLSNNSFVRPFVNQYMLEVTVFFFELTRDIIVKKFQEGHVMNERNAVKAFRNIKN